MGKKLALVWFLSFGADAISTHNAITQRGAHELLLPSQNPYVIDELVVGEAVIGWWALVKINPNHPKIARTLYWLCVATHSTAAIHNVVVR